MKIVFFTGAGISAESGIPTFRDYNGSANEKGFEELLTLSYFNKHPDETWKFLRGFLDVTKNAKPNEAHDLIASLEAPVITQNIDTFHQKAGSKRVIELHGTLGHCTCTKCGKRIPLTEKCDCGAYTKPDFTFYEENLDTVAYQTAEDLAKEADVFVVVGTSGQVYPAALLPSLAQKHGATVYEINPGVSGFKGSQIDFHIKKPAAEGIKDLMGRLKL